MTKSLLSFNASSNLKVGNNRWQPYFVLGIVSNAAIWGSALLFFQLNPPTYISALSAILPGSSDSNVSVPNVGNASYNRGASPLSQDARETYKIIATSDPVMRATAKRLNMSLKSFSERVITPRVKIVPNTSIMTFEVKAESPQEARDANVAFYQVFQARLDLLRLQENFHRDTAFQSAVANANKKLETAQKRLSDYKADSGLDSSAQISALSNNIEGLRVQRAHILAQQQQARTRLREISSSFNPSTQPAEGASIIQTDQIFQQNLKTYSNTSANLVDLNSKFLPNHPSVVAEQARRDAAQRALLSRSQYLLGRPISQATLKQLTPIITNDSAKTIISQQAEERALQSQAQEINKQIIQFESRLKTLVQLEPNLEAFNRDYKVAEAVFTSTLGKLDVGKSNPFGSYPVIQPLADPILSETLTRKFVLTGAILGSLFTTTGVISLWLRKRKTWIPKQEQEIETSERKKNNLSFPESHVHSNSL